MKYRVTLRKTAVVEVKAADEKAALRMSEGALDEELDESDDVAYHVYLDDPLVEVVTDD